MENQNDTAHFLERQFGLTDKVALITGGNSGLGLAMAKGLGKAGAKIAVIGRNAEKNSKAEAALLEEGVTVIVVNADVSQLGEVRQAVARVIDKFGALDVLINSAGVSAASAANQMTDSQWSSVMNTNFKGSLICCQEAYRVMKGSRDNPAKIINIADAYGFFGGSYVLAYAASKGAVVQLTRSLAVEWAPKHIRVNALVPGWFDTPMTAPLRMAPDAVKNIQKRIPLGKFGNADEIIGAAIFLASKASDYMTGAFLWVDGGFSAGS